jgi:hypothetical protein
MDRALGVRLYKPSPKDWPAAEWAIVGGAPVVVFASSRIAPPRTYSAAEALRHLHEKVIGAVRDHNVKNAIVWEIEGNARMNSAMRPRLRAEGVAVAAATLGGAAASLAAWREIQSLSGATSPKDEYEAATIVCGVEVGTADALAVLVAIAALKS